jgi:4-hydroxy-tetrahydrodipicolinate synthase
MIETPLKGIMAPVVTAFSNYRAIDAKRSTAHCHWLLKHGCDALVVFGTTSEANSLSLLERKSLLEAIVGSGIDPARLLVGTGSCALPDAVDLSEHALEIGCSGVLMLPPFYYKSVTADGLFAFFAELIDRVDDSRLRIYLYHIPPVAQVGIPFELIEKLRTRYGELIAGIKDSSGDWENTRRLLTEFASFDVFPGSEAFLLPALRLGAAGCISGTANVGAETMQRLYRRWQTGEAEEIQFKLNRVRATFQRFPIIAAVKAVLAEANNDDNWRCVRPPLQPLPNLDSQSLIRELQGLEFSPPRFGNE